jgi:hypothetical protein
MEDTHPALIDRWTTNSKSLLGTLLPGCLLLIGFIISLIGVLNVAFAFFHDNRGALNWMIACGIFTIILGIIPLGISVRTVEIYSDNKIYFASCWKNYELNISEVNSIKGLFLLLDAWGIYPVLVSTNSNHFLLVRQIDRGAYLENVLRQQNPNIILKRSLSYW